MFVPSSEQKGNENGGGLYPHWFYSVLLPPPSSLVSMPEVAETGDDHGNILLVGSRNNFGVAH